MASPKIIAPKKLIEVALPLEAINTEAARSKRKAPAGYPTTLHCWWAQRPLAAARAVLFAQLVNDPSWKYSETELKKPQIKSAITRKRNELFKLMAELVSWDNVVNEPLLKRARAEVISSWRETCEANKVHPDAARLFDPNRLPIFCDPFAGGGSLPLEAQRLGLRVRASDLNPVAVLINKALVEIPPRFSNRVPTGPISTDEKQLRKTSAQDWNAARGLAEDIRRYGRWMRDAAAKKIGQMYPPITVTKAMAKNRPDLKPYEGRVLPVIAYLWARTVKSANPAFADVDVPLAATFMLSTKAGRETWVEPIVNKKSYRFVVHVGKPKGDEGAGTKLARGANFRCLLSNSPIPTEHIYAEAMAGRMGSRLMAIVVDGDRGRLYLDPTDQAEALAKEARAKWKPSLAMPENPRWFSPPLYGLPTFGDLFTQRQLVALNTFCDLIPEVQARVLRDCVAAGADDDEKGLEAGGRGATAYSEAVATYLAFAIDRLADYGSSISTWRPKDSAMRSTMSRHAIAMSWDFAEGSPFGSSSCGFFESVRVVARILDFIPASVEGQASQGDAQSLGLEAPPIISTDPPYYDNIGYADLSDFFYIWLRRSIKPIFPDLFATVAVPKAEELVATPYRHGGKQEADAFFLDGMTSAMHRLAEQAECTTPVTIYYAFKQSETDSEGTASGGWETFLEAVIRAGFSVTGTWPVRTEGDNRQQGNDANALASSIVLVCRRREEAVGDMTRKEFLRELEKTLPQAIAEMTADPFAGIAPVDLAQACIGPGMAIFSKHNSVLEADGGRMPVHTALVHINKAIDDYFGETEGELDADTRFCITWFQLHGFDAGSFGDADNVARAKGTSVAGVREAGVLNAGKGKVRLYKIGELPKDWDPTEDSRVPIWEACHQLCRALDDSEGDAGALLAKMPEKQEAVRLLAYRLYTLCERKGWADQARAYNNLITSWPAIVEASQAAGVRGTQMDLI